MLQKILNYKCHPFVFGLYRMALSGFLFVYFLLFSNRWIEFYGPFGLSPIKLRDEVSFIRPSLLAYLHTDSALWIYYGLIIFMTIAMFFGRLRKLPAIFLWLTMISVQNSNGNNVNAEEFVLCLFTFYATLLPINETHVFDFGKRKFSDSCKPVNAWALIPFWIHIEIIYVISLPLKPYFDHAWIDGTLIYLAVNTFDMSRFPGLEIMSVGHAIVSKLLTWMSLLVEGAFPFLVWSRRYKVPAILSMVGFQVGIAVLLSGVQTFSLSMILALILFLPSESTHDLFADPSLSRLWSWFLPEALMPKRRLQIQK